MKRRQFIGVLTAGIAGLAVMPRLTLEQTIEHTHTATMFLETNWGLVKFENMPFFVRQLDEERVWVDFVGKLQVKVGAQTVWFYKCYTDIDFSVGKKRLYFPFQANYVKDGTLTIYGGLSEPPATII